MGLSSGNRLGNRRLRAAAASSALALSVAAMAGAGVAGAASPGAKAARTLSLNDSAKLHENNHKGIELKESGVAKGNLSGSIYIQLRIIGHSVTATIQVYPSGGGSVSATASAGYHIENSSIATFSGSMRITGGSGRYAKAKGSRLSFSGSVHRPGNAVYVHVSGNMSY